MVEAIEGEIAEYEERLERINNRLKAGGAGAMSGETFRQNALESRAFTDALTQLRATLAGLEQS
jgi:hypothetical protein